LVLNSTIFIIQFRDIGTACQVGIEIERSKQVILCFDFNFRISLLFKHKSFHLVNPDFIIITSLMTLVDALVAEQVSGPKSGTFTIREEASDICTRIDSSSKLQQTIQALVTRVNYLIAQTTLVPQSGLSADIEISVEKLGVATHIANDSLKEEISDQSPDFDLMPNKTSSTIKDFLGRPVLVRSGYIDGTTNGCFVLPRSSIIDWLGISTLLKYKIEGFFGIRYTMCIKLLFNAEKFQQGRVILGLIPTGGYIGNNLGLFNRFHACAIENRIQCLHEELDLGSETEITLRIPWNQATSFASVQNYIASPTSPPGGDCGFWFLSTYMPFRTGSSGSTSANYSVYMWMEDVELYGLTTQSGLTQVRRDVAYRLATKDGHDADPLSLNENSMVTTFDDDSGILEILKKKPSLMAVTNWSTSGTAGAYFASVPVLPGVAFNHTDSLSGHHVNYLTLSPMAFIGNLFGFWRGDIRVIIKLSKTSFHSGRMGILFVPKSKGTASVPMNASNDPAFERIIWDIRESNSIEFVVPYTSISPWTSIGTDIGTIQLQVLNPLVCPDTVSTTIDLVVEYYGTDSLEFAMPVRQYLRNYLPLSTQSGLSPVRLDQNVEKSDFLHINNLTHKRVTLGGSTSHKPIYNKRCIGDNVNSLKELLLRYCAYDNIEPQSTTGILVDYQPLQIDCNYLSPSGYIDVSSGMPSIFPLILAGFCLNAGDVEFKALSSNIGYDSASQHYSNSMFAALFKNSPGQPGWVVPPVKGYTETDVSTGTWLANVCGTSIAYSRADINGGVEIRVPQYHYDPYRASAMFLTLGSANIGDGLGGTAITIQFKIEGMESMFLFKRVAPNFVLRNFISFGAYAITATD